MCDKTREGTMRVVYLIIPVSSHVLEAQLIRIRNIFLFHFTLKTSLKAQSPIMTPILSLSLATLFMSTRKVNLAAEKGSKSRLVF
jgi:hypothetical protein